MTLDLTNIHEYFNANPEALEKFQNFQQEKNEENHPERGDDFLADVVFSLEVEFTVEDFYMIYAPGEDENGYSPKKVSQIDMTQWQETVEAAMDVQFDAEDDFDEDFRSALKAAVDKLTREDLFRLQYVKTLSIKEVLPE